MKDIRGICEHFLKTPWGFLHWNDLIEWISNEKLHLCEQGLTVNNNSAFSAMCCILL